MAHRRKIRNLSKISSLRELREARRIVDLKLWYTEQKISDDISGTFSVNNLLSLIAPEGSTADRIINGMTTGLATVRGIVNGIRRIRCRM